MPSETLILKDDEKAIVNVAKALASETRWAILKLLTEKEYDISRLATAMQQTEANVSAQVKHLEKAKLITCRYEPGEHGVRKVCKAVVNEIIIKIAQKVEVEP